jgi:tripartite-type tricarboxylate transporter receptor subunit TctC
LSEVLNQRVIVENGSGAGGMTGAQRVAQTRPDGYEVLLGTVGTHANNQTLYKQKRRHSGGLVCRARVPARQFALSI